VKQIILNVSDGVTEIEIQSRTISDKVWAKVVLDEVRGDTITLDVDCHGKIALRKITPVDFLNEMNKIARESGLDEEVAHSRMDALMCRVLQEQGFGTGVRVFNMQSKGYM
jgi:hypothetical protein